MSRLVLAPAQGGAAFPRRRRRRPVPCSYSCAYNCREPRRVDLKRILAGMTIGLLAAPSGWRSKGALRDGRDQQRLPWHPDHQAVAGDAPRPRATPARIRPRSPSSAPLGDGNGSAVIVMPVAVRGLAGCTRARVCRLVYRARFHAFILSYRLSSNGYLLPVPLIDARRAVQTVRARLRTTTSIPSYCHYWFSAGGHLAALSATQPVPAIRMRRPDRARLQPADAVVLGYPGSAL